MTFTVQNLGSTIQGDDTTQSSDTWSGLDVPVGAQALVVAITYREGAGSGSISSVVAQDAGGGNQEALTEIGDYPAPAGGFRAALFYGVNPTSGTRDIAITWSENINDSYYAAAAITGGLDTDNALDASIEVDDNDGVPLAVTTTTDGCAVFCVVATNANAGPFTPPTGWTELADLSGGTNQFGDVDTWFGWVEAGSAGQVDAQPSTLGGNWTAVVAAFTAGEAETAITGSGALSAGASAASGTGASGSTGSGAPAAGNATASGTGATGSVGTGALSAGSSVVEGAGGAEFPEITGSGALGAAGAAVEGEGASGSVGTATLATDDATATGAGNSGSAGSGAVTADAATVEGAGESGSTGTGALEAAAARVHGTASNIISGSGDLQAGSSAASGEGVSGSVGSGAVIIQFPTVAGAGASGSTGSGILAAVNAAVHGFDVPPVTLGRVTVSDFAVTLITVDERLAAAVAASDAAVTRITAIDRAA